jgi:hypothetical protein
MSSRIVLLAVLGFGLGLTGKANADLAPPLPASKESVKVKIEMDENAKGPRLIVPNGVFQQPRGPRPKLERPPQEEGEETAQEETQPRNHILIAGIALSLSLAFGGLWLMRRNGRSSTRAMSLLIVAGTALAIGAVVYANAPPPKNFGDRPPVNRPPASYPTAWEGGTKVEFTFGQEPVRLILDKESYKKLMKGELTVEKPTPNAPTAVPPAK